MKISSLQFMSIVAVSLVAGSEKVAMKRFTIKS